MGNSEQGLSIRDAALLAIEAAGGTIEGRTAMQKILYFVSVELGEDFGHRAHYFGPYSRAVENALTFSAMAGEVTETIERFPTYTTGPDIRKYTYELAPPGAEEVEEAQSQHPEDAEKLRETVEAVQGVVPDLNQHSLSMAAKVDYIVSNQIEDITVGQIPDFARKLGWSISEDQVRQSVDLLKRLGRVSVG